MKKIIAVAMLAGLVVACGKKEEAATNTAADNTVTNEAAAPVANEAANAAANTAAPMTNEAAPAAPAANEAAPQ